LGLSSLVSNDKEVIGIKEMKLRLWLDSYTGLRLVRIRLLERQKESDQIHVVASGFRLWDSLLWNIAA
jgi:hypothetical protein